ncbi:MAG: hypothetical protein ACJZ40_06435 [Candidatus Poseidoniaceae archaeon]
MKRIATPLGNLKLIKGACKKQIAAELRGLELLIELVKQSNVWMIDQRGKKPYLVSCDGAPGIQVDIFASMQKRILGGDPHLDILIAQEEACVMRSKSEVMTPSTDSMVSLVLLGNMGWPLKHTPSTLSDKAVYSLKQSEIFEDSIGTQLKGQDYQEIEFAMDCYQAGQHQNAVAILAEIGRRWYVCRSWEIEHIQNLLASFFSQLERHHVEAYIEAPQCKEDVMFIAL